MKKIAAQFALLLLTLTGCATSTTAIDELDMSLAELNKIAISALPIGKRIESRNGREFYSAYFTVRKGEYEEAVATAIRNYAVISILGDRRPYKLEVSVIIERKNAGGEFEKVGHDAGLARVLARRIQNTLYKRRDNRNIIDDFRVF